jgi:menaquinone-dependent protoporphyrinogen oxidase
MNILMVVASRHGSTREIADAIAEEVRKAGHTADVRDAGEVGSAELYDAAIVGSAIYMGNWLPEARRFVERNRAWLATVPVWLFSSGPIGQDDPQPHGNPANLGEVTNATRAQGHRIFVGKLDKGTLGLGERLAVKLVRAPEGDFRDWDAIRSWARDVASALPTAAASPV